MAHTLLVRASASFLPVLRAASVYYFGSVCVISPLQWKWVSWVELPFRPRPAPSLHGLSRRDPDKTRAAVWRHLVGFCLPLGGWGAVQGSPVSKLVCGSAVAHLQASFLQAECDFLPFAYVQSYFVSELRSALWSVLLDWFLIMSHHSASK